MFRLEAQNLSQAYHRRFVFRSVDLTLQSGESAVILGGNGSGKSTLLKTLSRALVPFEGDVRLFDEEEEVDSGKQFFFTSLAAPYLELIEEYTLREFFAFCGKLKPWKSPWTIEELVKKAYLEEAADREIKYFSSGMKQRVRLIVAIMADTPVLLLDEPTSNLDKKGVEWYRELMEEMGRDRIVLVASNENAEEYYFCDRELRIEDFK